MRAFLALIAVLLLLPAAPAAAAAAAEPEAPPGAFVSLHDVDPSIVIEMRYLTPHNFIGRRIPGYRENVCLLTRPAAEALKNVQETEGVSRVMVRGHKINRHLGRLAELEELFNPLIARSRRSPDFE